jgi:hypothetical protein
MGKLQWTTWWLIFIFVLNTQYYIDVFGGKFIIWPLQALHLKTLDFGEDFFANKSKLWIFSASEERLHHIQEKFFEVLFIWHSKEDFELGLKG